MRINTLCSYCIVSILTLSLCSCLSCFSETPPAAPPKQEPAPLVIETTAPGFIDKWAVPGEPVPHISAAGTKDAPDGEIVKESPLEPENNRRLFSGKSNARLNSSNAPSSPDDIRQMSSQTSNIAPPGSREAAYWGIVERALRIAWSAEPEAASIRRLSRQGDVGEAELVLHITPNGTVAAAAMQKSSGSIEIDRALLRTARSLRQLPPPPSGAGPVHLVFEF